MEGPYVWAFPLIMLADGNNVVFWLLASALFDDGFRLRPWHGALWLVMVGLGLCDCLFGGSRLLGIALTLSSLVFAGLALLPTLSSWKIDLVEGRRRLRLFIVGAASLYIAVTAMLFSRRARRRGFTSGAVTTKSPVITALPPPVGWKLITMAVPIAGGTGRLQ